MISGGHHHHHHHNHHHHHDGKITVKDKVAGRDGKDTLDDVEYLQFADGIYDVKNGTMNYTPVITSNGGGANAALNVAENQTAVTTVTAVDAGGGTLTFSIVGGADAAKFTIDSVTGALSFIAPPDFETPTDNGGNNVYDVIVKVSDGTTFDTQAIAITVTDANEAPTAISLASTSVGAGNGAGTVVGGVTVSDPDGETSFTFAVTNADDSPNADFVVTGSPGAYQLELLHHVDELPASIQITATDGGGLSHTQSFAITLPAKLYDTNHTTLLGSYSTIQAAVDAAGANQLISIASGTYAEQVIVSGHGKDGLTIQADAGATVDIVAPLDVTQTATSSSGRAINALITVIDADDVHLGDLNVDGLGRANTVDGPSANFVGVAYRNASGGLTDVDITGIRDPYAVGTTVGGDPLVSGIQRGVGVQADNDTLLAFYMHGGSIGGFQKNATSFFRTDLDIDGVTITGGGAQTINAQNGIQAVSSTGSIANNTITGIGYAGPSFVYSGAILLFDNTDLDVTGNVVAGSNDQSLAAKVAGIFVFSSASAISGGSITGNSVSHADIGVGVYGDIQPDGIAISGNTVTDVDTSDPFASGVDFWPDTGLTTAFNVSGSDVKDFLNGAAAADVLNGQGGDDYLKGNGGDDAIDGGAGDFDTAYYDGVFADYNIGGSLASLTVEDTVVSRDGTDGLSDVEYLQFADATYNVASGDVWSYQVNATVDPVARDPGQPPTIAHPNGFLFQGTGNPATGFGIARNEDAGIELGFKVIYRSGPNVLTTDDYADGVLRFNVNDGPQSTVNGSSGNDATRAAWNYTYSVATGLNGETTSLDDFVFRLLFDVDPSLDTEYLTFQLEPEVLPGVGGSTQSNFVWRSMDNPLVVVPVDDEGNANVTQNSRNYGFGEYQANLTSAYGPGNSFAGPAHFDMILQAYDLSNNLIAQNHIGVDVIL
ncbi:MAG: cadherin repeat domain-containing protein [Alphaproteobacteria bacterium]|nr:cadherin repeat domain-containing protein [Alphaproteobacteria bacterium]